MLRDACTVSRVKSGASKIQENDGQAFDRQQQNERPIESFMGYLPTERNNPTAVLKTKRTAACNSRHKPSRPSYATADFEEASVSALQQGFGT